MKLAPLLVLATLACGCASSPDEDCTGANCPPPSEVYCPPADLPRDPTVTSKRAPEAHCDAPVKQSSDGMKTPRPAGAAKKPPTPSPSN